MNQKYRTTEAVPTEVLCSMLGKLDIYGVAHDEFGGAHTIGDLIAEASRRLRRALVPDGAEK